MNKITLPRKSTVARILRSDATVAHTVAHDICYSLCIYWCQVASYSGSGSYVDQAERTASALRHLFGNLNAAEYTGRVAQRAVRRVWDDERDCCDPSDVGKFSLADGTPLGLMDVCAAAGLVSASLVGLVEPADEYGDIIAEWFRDIIEREWRGRQTIVPAWRIHHGKATADIIGDVLSPRSALAWIAETEAKWPVTTKFRARLDAILGEALRGHNVQC